jgi:hypothetical protein
MYSTRSAQQTAEDAVQIFGGRGITKTGMGRHIEHYHRTVPFDALLGGGTSFAFMKGPTLNGDCSGGCPRRPWCATGYACHAQGTFLRIIHRIWH